MSIIFSADYTLIGVICGIYIVSMALQCLHTHMLLMRRKATPFVPVIVYEVLVAIHLVLCAILLRDALGNYDSIALWINDAVVPYSVVAWFNILPIALGLVLMVYCRRPLMGIELFLFAIWLPPLTHLFHRRWTLLLIIAACYLLFRSLSCLLVDYQKRHLLSSRFSPADAMDAISEGVLCANKRGQILFMNKTMQALLKELGYTGMLSNVKKFLAECRKNSYREVSDTCFSFKTPDERIWELHVNEEKVLHRQCLIILVYETTELEQLNARLEQANLEQQWQEKQLLDLFEMVNDVANNNALEHMQARVHDVIGQRLSILHRYIEDDSLDVKRLEELCEIIDNIMNDLKPNASANQQEVLKSIVEAFALVDVAVATRGELPRDEKVAAVFNQAIRESVTNAVRHGHAQNVLIRFGNDEETWTLSIEDDGVKKAKDIKEGRGIPGMRKAVAQCDGELTIQTLPTFAVQVKIPYKIEREVLK